MPRRTLNRRDLLAGTTGALGAAFAAPLWAGGREGRTAPRRLVLLVLDGGNDGLNTLAPIEDDAYHKARPALALAAPDARRVDELNAFHPSLARTAERFREGGVCVLRGVGYDTPNLSHFRSMDIWSAASLALPMPATGWAGRLVDAALDGERGETPMLSVGDVAVPFALRASRNVASVVPNRQQFRVRSGPSSSSMDELDARRRALDVLNGGAGSVGDAVAAATASSEAIAAALERSPRVEYPKTKLAQDLGIVARVAEAGLPTRCFYVAQKGYDTHAAQAGTHAELLATLDAALDAFLRDLAACDALGDTLVLVLSEFGRRVAENGVGATAGTDHGAASLVMLLGGGIRPGLHGGQPRLDDVDENGNLRHSIDFRSVYADVAKGWFGVDAASVLGGEFAPAGVVVA
ncbi:MAG: DUF1501 domain-containing protein [Planctomycetota bacterium]